ncbi:MAG: GTPase [Burkholderiaceae bacterium]
MIRKTPVTLVTGGTAGMREAAIAAWIGSSGTNTSHSTNTIGIILEGIPDGTDSFATLANSLPYLTIVRIAPGCPCCIGNLTMRVTLNRILRHPPDYLYISMATPLHLDQVRRFLMQPPYDKLIELAKDIFV